jgi:hypothetical protein
MRRFALHAAVFLWAALLLAPGAGARPTLLVGAAEDSPKNLDPLVAMSKMELARRAGFDSLRLTVTWSRGHDQPSTDEAIALQNAATAAALTGIRLYVNVYPTGSRQTPLTNAQRKDFVDFTVAIARANPTITDFIIGNEPNLNRFWMPQFTRSGADAAAPMYVTLLALTYDALKEVSRKINVIGGAVSPRGVDKARTKRQTHSPTKFIPDLGKAYRRLRRRAPIMDAFAYHPYSRLSRISPTIKHPEPWAKTVTIADYDRLVGLLSKAFAGTAQRGLTLPIVYDEFGVQTAIPTGKRKLYFNHSALSGRDAVGERVQARYYRAALKLAYCQPTVEAFLIFHLSDEPDLDRWQSGLFYADDTPKSSFEPVRKTVAATRGGYLTRCRQVHVAPARARRPHSGTGTIRGVRRDAQVLPRSGHVVSRLHARLHDTQRLHKRPH